jgi:predicted amidohydrolase
VDFFRLALAQLEPRLFDKTGNLDKAEKAIRKAAAQDAAVVIFPELYLTGYTLAGRANELAEPLDGPSGRRVAELARDNRVAILMGFAERSDEGGKPYDAVLIADARGRLCASIRKTHLFHEEKNWFIAGEALQVVDFGLGCTGVLVCYDLEFPEAARALALRGAGWIATCTGNMAPNQHLQEVYLQSRAAENRLWVAAANRIGREGDLLFFGGSAVANPEGRLTAQAGDQETVLCADIDLTCAEPARRNADYLADRRADLYDVHKI